MAELTSSPANPTQEAAIHVDNHLLTNENILASLAVKADLNDDVDVRACVKAYKLNATVKSHKAAIGKFTKDVLIKTLIFLNVKGVNWDNWLKPRVVNEVICRIENLLTDNCHICGEVFATGLDDSLLLQCELCGQNMHQPCLINLLGDAYHENITHDEVLNILNPCKVKGFHYLCHFCSEHTIPSDAAESNTKASRKTTAEKQSPPPTTQIDNNASTNRTNTPQIENSTGEKKENNDLGNAGKKKRDGDFDSNSLPDTNEIDLTKEKHGRDRDDICFSFLKGQCPHGISGKSCEKFHPRVCNRYRKNGSSSKYGCTKGERCTFFHPDICPNSLRSRTCFNKDCSFRWHLPRTARIERDQTRSNWYNHTGYLRRRTDYNYKTYKGQSQYDSSRYYTSDNSQNVPYDTNYNPQQFMCDGHASGSCGSRSGGWEGGWGPGQGEPHAVSAETEGSPINPNSFSFLARSLQETVAEQLKTALQQIPLQIQAELSKIQTQPLSNALNQPQQFQQDHLLKLTGQEEQLTQRFPPGIYPILPHSVSHPHPSQTYNQC